MPGPRGAGKSASRAEALRLEATRGWPPGLTTLTGDDLWRLDAAQATLLEVLAPARGEALALTVFGAGPVEVGAVVAAARSVSMFSPRRVVFVRDHEALDGDPAALVEYARQPPPASFLLVRAPGLDRRLKLGRALAQEGRLLEFALPKQADPAAAAAAVREAAREHGLELDAGAAVFLAELAAGDGYALESELGKLAAFLGGPGRVTQAVARELAARASAQQSGWELANAITLRDRGAALAAPGRLVDAGEHPLKILGGVAWRARAMLQARALLDAGVAHNAVVQAVAGWRFKDELRRGMPRWTRGELLGFPTALLCADRALKGSALDPRAVLENLARRLIDGRAEGLR